MSLYPFRKGFNAIELPNRTPQRSTGFPFPNTQYRWRPRLPVWTAGLASHMLLPTWHYHLQQCFMQLAQQAHLHHQSRGFSDYQKPTPQGWAGCKKLKCWEKYSTRRKRNESKGKGQRRWEHQRRKPVRHRYSKHEPKYLQLQLFRKNPKTGWGAFLRRKKRENRGKGKKKEQTTKRSWHETLQGLNTDWSYFLF